MCIFFVDNRGQEGGICAEKMSLLNNIIFHAKFMPNLNYRVCSKATIRLKYQKL